MWIDFSPKLKIKNKLITSIWKVGYRVVIFLRLTGLAITGRQLSNIFDSYYHVPTIVFSQWSFVDFKKFKIKKMHWEEGKLLLLIWWI